MVHQADIANQKDTTQLGFWIYLMTDCVLFASLFATYVVLRNSTNGEPGGAELFQPPYILVETIILLVSSLTAGLGLLAYRRREKRQVLLLFGATIALGLAFLALEINEFRHLISDGHSWESSAFLSAFFTLVGTHGLHITAGLIWISVLLWRFLKQGFNDVSLQRFSLFALFWHFLDIIWIFIFSIVYLMGIAGL